MIKAIVFDMDGVLIDAKDWHYEALNKALGLFGMEISRHEHLVTFDGLPTKKKLNMLSKEKNLPSSLHGFINEMKQIYTMELTFARCKPVFQHEYALSDLSRRGYKLAVASNSVRNTVQVMMDKSNLLPYLEFYLSNEDVEKSKPDPEIYLKAMDKLEVQPSECLVLEDNDHGIAAAKASGAYVMEVSGTSDVRLSHILDFIESVAE